MKRECFFEIKGITQNDADLFASFLYEDCDDESVTLESANDRNDEQSYFRFECQTETLEYFLLPTFKEGFIDLTDEEIQKYQIDCRDDLYLKNYYLNLVITLLVTADLLKSILADQYTKGQLSVVLPQIFRAVADFEYHRNHYCELETGKRILEQSKVFNAILENNNHLKYNIVANNLKDNLETYCMTTERPKTLSFTLFGSSSRSSGSPSRHSSLNSSTTSSYSTSSTSSTQIFDEVGIDEMGYSSSSSHRSSM